MRVFIVLVIASLLFSCAVEKEKSSPPPPSFTTEEGEPMLYGVINRAALQQAPYVTWFDTTYAAYALDSQTLESLPQGLPGTDLLVFMGTWCEDSQREVPRFFKILDYLHYDASRIKLVCLDEEKQGPEEIHETWQIESVPTFIFLKDSVEVGRIVEFPEESLEQDIAGLMQKAEPSQD